MVMALLVGTTEDSANSRPAKNVAAIKIITKDTFLSIDKLLREDFGRLKKRGCFGELMAL
jgi:hypothetical protein